MTDLFKNFAALRAAAVEGADFRIQAEERGSAILVMAPHGGGIERGTSEVARAVALEDISIYLFEGMRRSNNGELHITSTNFDEPKAMDLLEGAATVIAIHGRQDGDDVATVWVGGRDAALRDAIGESLSGAGFRAATARKLPGLELANICNRGTSAAGVQLEIPLSLRRKLIDDPVLLESFGKAIRRAI